MVDYPEMLILGSPEGGSLRLLEDTHNLGNNLGKVGLERYG